MKSWVKWLLLSLFLLVLGIIQFIPGETPPSTPETLKDLAEDNAPGQPSH